MKSPTRARLILVLCVLALCVPATLPGQSTVGLTMPAQSTRAFTPAERQVGVDSFEKVWTTIRDKHWQKEPGGLDWQAIHTEYRPRVEKAANLDEVRDILREMLGRLHQTHFNILPSTVYAAVDQDAPGAGQPGIDLRVLDGHAIVTRVDGGSPAEQAGVKPGWQVVRAGAREFDALIRQAQSDATIPELTLTRSLLARLSGDPGQRVHAEFLDGAGKKVELELALAPPRGQSAVFGNLPQQHVWFESKRIGNVAYLGFNMFLDLVRVMSEFEGIVKDCTSCGGLIIDLRGNPGGIGGMAIGMAGFLVDQPNQRLGTMQTRDLSLNFAINPRPVVFNGPVAVLIDACSASTSEIFAGGLQDLHRARVFGTHSAAAALPSVIERLPDGDGFQYAMANYLSGSGKPLEGNGVEPDVAVKLDRTSLLAGRDPVVDAALDWIKRSAR